MTLTKDITAKFAVAAVAVAMIFSAYAPAAQAQTTEDLQQMINDLLAQVAMLQAQAGGNVEAPASAPSVCPYTWTRDLTQGSEGADVMMLQQFLNSYPDLRVAATGAGSSGMETMYYGPATAAAVSKMQVMFRAEVLTPNGLVNPTGYFGASSRAKANSLCVAPAPTPEEETEGEEGEEMEEEEEKMTLSGEASLGETDLDNGESSIEEGDEDVVVGEFTAEFEDGDAEISRIDVTLVRNNQGGTDTDGDVDPWDVFDTVSIWVDGDMIEEVDASDEDEYLDETAGEIRFSNLGIIAEEDEEIEILIAVSVQNNLDGVGVGNDERWDLDVTSMRFFDADGVADTVNPGVATIDFDIDEAGADEELKISLASNNPDSTDIIVDTNTDTDGVTIMVADLEAEDNDIELNSVTVKVDTVGASTTAVVDSIYVVIDGQTFDAENVSATGKGTFSAAASRYVDNDVSDDAIWYVFDIDGDVTIDEDDEVEMEVVVDFNDTDDGVRYSNGTTIQASVTSVEMQTFDAEGADDLSTAQLTGTAIGDDHILVAEGIVVPVDGFTSTENTLGQDDTIGEFTLEFEVTAVEGDFYITENAAAASTSPTDGVAYTVSGGNTTSVTDSLTSTADEDTIGVFTVREGETETFTLVVTVDAAAAGTFRVALDEVIYSANANGTASPVTYTVTPATDFRSAPQSINQI